MDGRKKRILGKKWLTMETLRTLLLGIDIAIVDDLAPQVELISSNKMTPLTPTQHPYIRDLMVSIMVFGKLLVEPKTLGWEISWKSFKNGFENLRVVSTPLKCFINDFGTNGNWDIKRKERSGWF
jgi:hypothetical protein